MVDVVTVTVVTLAVVVVDEVVVVAVTVVIVVVVVVERSITFRCQNCGSVKAVELIVLLENNAPTSKVI